MEGLSILIQKMQLYQQSKSMMILFEQEALLIRAQKKTFHRTLVLAKKLKEYLYGIL